MNGGPPRIKVVDLTRKDLLEYRKWLLDKEMNSTRAAGNKLTRISQWYRDSLKLKPGEGIITTRDTRFGATDREPEIYTAEELHPPQQFEGISGSRSLRRRRGRA